MARKKTDVAKSDKAMRAGRSAGAALEWHSPDQPPFRLVGLAWFENDRLYRRMPLKPKEKLPDGVDALANCTAGAQIGFRTDSRKLAVRVRLTGLADLSHMPATGQCGFDCYLGPAKRQRFVGVTQYDHHRTHYEIVLFELARRRVRNVTLNFPLYMGVREVQVGLERRARILPPPAYDLDGRVVVYGTSVTQGGCAARPGMAYTNILSRRLNVEFVNLGFSGSGRGEPEVARTIAEIPNVALFVLDYEGNCGTTRRLRETFARFIRILRDAHPDVPLLAVSRVAFARDLLSEESRRTRLERKSLQQKTVARLRRAGDGNVFFADGSAFLGTDFDECTVDGVHPTDLGFLRIADSLQPVIARILKRTWSGTGRK